MFRINRFQALMTIAMVAAGASVVSAQTQCSTPSGAAVPGGQVNAQASFSTGAGFVTVTLTNLLADPKSAGQLLNGVSFTLSEGETTGTLGSTSADIRSVASGGAFTDFGPASTGWALAQNLNSGLLLCVLCTDLGAVGPKHLLIGSPATDNNYDSANASIAGNRPHNPFTAGTATFLVNVPGVTALSTVTGATFFFSTAEGVSVAGNCGPQIQPE